MDGIALAIELAGSQVGTYGLRATADLLNHRFRLLWQGRRSALPRHQTLAAMLDWSFHLLSTRERRVLARLSIFVGVFTLDAALAVAADGQTDVMDSADAITRLTNKSLIWVPPADGIAHYRLLDSTQAFAAEKLALTTEGNALAKRHALYYAQYLSSRIANGVAITIEDAAGGEPYLANIRAALDWSFSSAGDAAIGVRLAMAAAPLLFKKSLFIECIRWCGQGLASLHEPDEGSPTHLTLQAFLAASAMFTRGNSDEVRSEIEAALNLAETLGDREYQMHLLVGLGIFLTRIGDFKGALAVARRSMTTTEASARRRGGRRRIGVRRRLPLDWRPSGRSASLRASLTKAAAAGAAQIAFFGYDHEIRALIALARCYWLIGLPDRAAETARWVIDVATERNDPVDLCMTLIYTATVFLWRGDLDVAEQLIQRLIAHAARHSLGPIVLSVSR